jgi:hypothetical protein
MKCFDISCPQKDKILPQEFPQWGNSRSAASVINSIKIDIIVQPQTIYGFVSTTLEREGYKNEIRRKK